VASAQRGLESANRSYRQALDAVAEAETRAARAQRAVSEARAEAKEDIDDLNRALRSAKLDEEAATLAVTDALRELNAVRLTGNIPDIQRADIAYRQAQLTLEDAKDTAEDYGKEQATANKRGVEGSDKVVAALEDQAQAQKAVKDAQDGVVDAQNGILAAQDALASANDSLKSSYDGLKSAQDSLASAQTKAQSASAGVAREVIKLAPAAQKFVDAVKALKPAFEDLRLDVQQKLFKDLDVTVTNLGKAWIPALKTTLGDYATTFNGFFQTLGANISTPTFIGQLQTAAEGARKGIEAVGEAISGPLVTAFGQLAEKSAPFLETIGDVLAGIVTDFAKWIDDSYKTGELQDFFETAASAVKSLGGTVRGTGRLIKNLFAIIFRGNGKNDKSAIDSFNDGLRRLNEWLEDPANQDSIATFLDGWKTQFEDFKKSFGSINELLGGGPEAQAKADELGTMIGRALISGILAGLKEQVSDQFKGEAWLMFFGPIGGLVYWIRKLMGINSPSTVMMEIGNFIIDGLVGGIKDKLEKVKETAKKIPGKIREGVGNALETLKTKGGQFVDGLKTGIGAKFTELKTKASELKTKASEGLAGASKTLYGRGREVVGGLMSGIGGRFKELRTFAGYAQDYIQYALRSAGNFLYDHGRAVIFGLIDGISSTLDTLGSFLGRIGSFIQNHKGPIEKDRTLLVGAGQAIMSGLIVGIGDRKKALAAELSDVTNLVGSTRLPALASDLGSVSANLSVQRSAQVQVAWAEGSTGDPLLDAIRRSVKFKWNGDPQAAFAS
jgi:phage-related protein